MGDLSDFQTGQTVGTHLAGESLTKTAVIRCIQSSSLQGIHGIYKSWEDIIN